MDKHMRYNKGDRRRKEREQMKSIAKEREKKVN